MYYLYILESISSGKFYVGYSENPERRLEFHNSIEKGFTSRYRPWKIVYTKVYYTKKEAMEAERLVKGWKSRKKVIELVNGKISLC